MPTLTYQSHGTRKGGILSGRVLIGRKLSHGIVLDDPHVARLHAWIDPIDENHWILTDTGSKAGTFINNQRVNRQELRDGDVIRLGPTELQFHGEQTLADDIQPTDLAPVAGGVQTAGILFDCHCGAPLWVANDLAGKRGLCRYCKKTVTVPGTHVSTPAASILLQPPIKAGTKCGVCHAVIAPTDSYTQCQDCAIFFHRECWQENLGCSSYGCVQVESLKPKPKAAPTAVGSESVAPLRSGFPWSPALLAASVVGSVLGSVLFGGLAFITSVAAVVILIRNQQPRRALLVVALIVSLLGVVAGLIVSDFWYFNARHLPGVLLQHLAS